MQDHINKLEQELKMCKETVDQRLEEGDAQMKGFAVDIEEIKTHMVGLESRVSRIEKDIKELLDIFRASKGFIRVMGWIGQGIKWSAAVALAMGGLWIIFKDVIKTLLK